MLYASIGDRGPTTEPLAQDLSNHNGKIVRLYDDGRVPADNPFVGRPGAKPEIYSYGHRNPQGMTINPETGEVWASEHGPMGGDEVNIIKRGANYGWPTTEGMTTDPRFNSPRYVYDHSTGHLYYDADGNGSGAQVLVATFSNHANLTLSDFFVV